MATKSSPKSKQARPKTSKPVSTTAPKDPRRIKPPKRKWFRRTDKRFRKPPVKLPSSFTLTKRAYQLLAENWKLVGGIILVYGVLALILVHGINGGTNVTALKQDVNQLFQGNWGHVVGGLTIFGLLLTSSGTTASDVAGAYQSFLILIVSLALVWTFRQVLANPSQKYRIRDGFYQGMYPLVPVLLVLVVVGLQLIPALIGAVLYNLVQNGIVTTAGEQLIWLAILLIGISISLYMLCSSLFALYIATLPNMTPLKALRSARRLVRRRRLSIIRKLLFLILVLVLLSAIIMVPIILFLTPVAQWVFFVLTLVVIAAVHAYGYTLYRQLLVE